MKKETLIKETPEIPGPAILMTEEKPGIEIFAAGYKGAERRFVRKIMREGEERRRAAPPAKEGEVDWVSAAAPSGDVS